MKIEKFSSLAQAGLQRWALDRHGDEMLFDANASATEFWAWIYFQLRVSEDRPEWFPKGKSAILQCLEDFLLIEAREVFSPGPIIIADLTLDEEPNA